jgi:nucleotide-binding universal stress UspA family protein
MTGIKTILVPVDFSAVSKPAVNHAFALAEKFGSKVLLAHIVPNADLANRIMPTESYAIEHALYDAAKEDLPKLIPAAVDNVKVHTIVKVGAVDAELLTIVQENNVDLVVMGTHGRRALSRWFLGSTTERMLRNVPVPVLTLSHLDPEKQSVSSGWPIRRILYATDLGEDSKSGFNLAVEIGRKTGASVTVLHCVEQITGTWSSTMTDYLENQYERRLKSAQERLQAFMQRSKPDGVILDSLIVEGTPYEKILEVAKTRGIDLIVINLHGKASAERAFLGSTSDRVVRLAGIPVLGVPLAISDAGSKPASVSA